MMAQGKSMEPLEFLNVAIDRTDLDPNAWCEQDCTVSNYRL